MRNDFKMVTAWISLADQTVVDFAFGLYIILNVCFSIIIIFKIKNKNETERYSKDDIPYQD